jgi:hypothetical protein
MADASNPLDSFLAAIGGMWSAEGLDRGVLASPKRAPWRPG